MSFLVSKVLPQHATMRAHDRLLRGQLRRLGTDYLDLQLLHWRRNVALEDTIAGFESLPGRDGSRIGREL